MSSIQDYEALLVVIRGQLQSAKKSKVTAVNYLKANGEIEEAKQLKMCIFLLEQRYEAIINAIQHYKMCESSAKEARGLLIDAQVQVKELREQSHVQSQEHKINALRELQKFFKTLRFRHFFILNLNPFLKGENEFQTAICRILRQKQVKRYEGEYMFQIGKEASYIGPAYRQTGEKRFLYDKHTFIHRCVEFLFTYDEKGGLKYDFLSTQYTSLPGLLNDKEAEEISLATKESVLHFQMLYNAFYRNIPFIQLALKRGIEIGTDEAEADMLLPEQQMPDKFQEMFDDVERVGGMRERSRSLLKSESHLLEDLEGSDNGQPDSGTQMQEEPESPEVIRQRKSSIRNIRAQLVKKTQVAKYPPIFLPLFNQLVTLFFPTSDFPLKYQFKELQNIISILSNAYPGRILQHLTKQPIPKQIGELYKAIFATYGALLEFTRDVLGVSSEYFSPEEVAQLDGCARVMFVLQKHVTYLQKQIFEMENSMQQVCNNISEMYEQLMMSCDFLEAEIQSGGCQNMLVYEGDDQENW